MSRDRQVEQGVAFVQSSSSFLLVCVSVMFSFTLDFIVSDMLSHHFLSCSFCC